MKYLKLAYLYIDAIIARIARAFRKKPKVFFTSDTHWGHRNVILYCNRPFSSVEQMDKFLTFQWNCYIAPNDIVYHLGDVGINGKTPQRIGNTLNGIKFLIPGNHDSQFKFVRRKPESVEKYVKAAKENGWTDVFQTLGVQFHFTQMYLSHLPPKKLGIEAYDDRYMEERKDHQIFGIHLHGHVHQAYTKIDNIISVCWDAHHKPLTLEEIYKIYRDPRKFIPSKYAGNKTHK